MDTQTTRWTRNTDGSYSRDGWTIRKVHLRGNGQSRPFEHVSIKARDIWSVEDPMGFQRTAGSTLAGAKVNADRQIEIRAQKA
jgi:hypothetical protein